ncbi:hypothetical protein ABZ650_20530 [Streptomyces griseoviridis]|uniref:hypothetical protein n=1 Tax=Streptomyces griseoviridis TaxID=45398 RepID=UPI00340A9A9C
MRNTTAVLLLAAGLALTGCSTGGSASKAKAAGSPSPTPSADPAVAFMAAVEKADFPSYEDGIPAYQELTEFPPKWCAALKEGHSVEWMLSNSGGLYPIGMDWGTKKADAYQLVLLGSGSYCPEREAVVREELRGLGEY